MQTTFESGNLQLTTHRLIWDDEDQEVCLYGVCGWVWLAKVTHTICSTVLYRTNTVKMSIYHDPSPLYMEHCLSFLFTVDWTYFFVLVMTLIYFFYYFGISLIREVIRYIMSLLK